MTRHKENFQPKTLLVPPIETITEEGKENKQKKAKRGKSIRFKEEWDKLVFAECNNVIQKEYMRV